MDEKEREDIDKKIRRKLGIPDEESTSLYNLAKNGRTDYTKELNKEIRKREAASAAPFEYQVSDEALSSYPSYGWPLKCAWCHFGKTIVKAADCDGITFLCNDCGRPNVARRQGNTITISPGSLMPWKLIIWIIFFLGLILWAVFKKGI